VNKSNDFANHDKAIFKKEHLDKYAESKNNSHQIHFRTSQRQFIMSEILNSIVYLNEKSSFNRILSKFRSFNRNKNIRLVRLLKENIFKAAYPLHEGILDKNSSKTNFKNTNDRQLLFNHWASWKCLFKFQPLDEIEHYFGPKIAFYFAWLGFYTTWLLPMALLGLFFFLFGNFDPSFKDKE
jgi:anoctamin-7